MKVVEFAGQTKILNPPDHWNQDIIACGGLPVRIVVSEKINLASFTSCWKPTAGELAELNAGGVVTLTILGQSHPVVHVGTGKVNILP